MNNAVQSLHIGNHHIGSDGIIFTFYGQNAVVERADSQGSTAQRRDMSRVHFACKFARIVHNVV